MACLSIEEARNRLEETGLKVSRVQGTHFLLAQFPQGYYIAIGEHVAKELAGRLEKKTCVTPDQISEYFRTRIFYGANLAGSALK